MTTDARALIEEGKRHDEAMSKAHWTYSPTSGNVEAPNGGPNQYLSTKVCELFSMNHRANGNGIAWLRTNLAALLTGYAAALDEVDRLRKLTVAADSAVSAYGEIERRSGEEVLKLRTSLSEQSADLTLWKSRYDTLETSAQTAEAGLFHANLELGELKLVLEQQDREMERMRAALQEALDHWRYPPLDAEEKARRDEIWSLAHHGEPTITGAPCTTTK